MFVDSCTCTSSLSGYSFSCWPVLIGMGAISSTELVGKSPKPKSPSSGSRRKRLGEMRSVLSQSLIIEIPSEMSSAWGSSAATLLHLLEERILGL